MTTEHRTLIFYKLCEYLTIKYPSLNADQLRTAAECGLVQAEDIAKEEDDSTE